MYFWKSALPILGFYLALWGLAAQAGPTTVLEVKIELRVLDFISDPADRSAVAVLYDHDDQQSEEDAAAILKSLQDASALARTKIAPRLVERRSLATAGDLKAVILPAGLLYDGIMQYGIANRTLVMSSGTGCVREHRCMVGVTAQPEVEIGVDAAAVRAGHIQFADGFQLMVKEY